MNKSKLQSYYQYLGALALSLGAVAALSPTPASAASELALGESAQVEVTEMASQAIAFDATQAAEMAPSWNNLWDNTAWPESTWAQIWIPPRPGVAAAEAPVQESLTDILADLS